MGLFFWKNNKIIDTFASEAANSLFSSVQPQAAQAYYNESLDKKQAKQTGSSLDRVIQDLIHKIKEFRQIHSLGIYGKARLHMKFKERLEELGYPSDVADRINRIIMLRTP